MINNLGTRLFKSVTDKAGDLGDKFEEEFSRLSHNITVLWTLDSVQRLCYGNSNVHVILLMPTEDGQYKRTSTMYADPQTKNVIDRIQRESFELFNDYEPSVPRMKPPKLSSMRNKH
ncbi:hypothetical protein NECAME_07698 [Necator americanus]|uniref:Uncharacterized protein n=1 Tax=Necator americanus TaxID=51031 RepID=W2TL95_NECAM|nr:hypothetical protein NECAME_07698 [Necator americanus]ETN82865.1 hypothetical protein NECAME_07698 [Necator americanus]